MADLRALCDRLRSLHVPGSPLVLPNAWDAASARAVAAAGFPAVASTSSGVARSLGHEDEERAPREEMFAAAGRIVRSVDVPVTVDAEAGYGLEPGELVAALREVGAAGCNLEETDHAAGALRKPDEQAARLAAVREAAEADGYGLVVNARIDVFLGGGPQAELLPDALRRARAYLEAGADCVYPIGLHDRTAVAEFVGEAGGPVNVLASLPDPGVDELAALGVARISFGGLLQRRAVERLADELASIG